MDLQQQIDDLKRQINDMKMSFTMPREIRDAMAVSLFDKEETIANMTRTGTAAVSVSQTINVGGGGSGTVVAPAYPDGYIVLKHPGGDKYIPYFKRT